MTVDSLFRSAMVKLLLRHVLAVVLMVAANTAICQPGTNPIWEQRIGGPGDQSAADIQTCFDGGYIVVGSSRPSGADPLDIYAVRLQLNGDTIWTQTYDDTNTGTSVAQTQDSNFVIVGAGGARCILKVNGAGDTLWTRTYQFAGAQDGADIFSVRVTADGGLVLVGSGQAGPPTWVDVVVIRTDVNGDTLWACSYGFGQDNADEGYDIWQTSDHGFLIVGKTTTSFPVFDSHPLVFRLTASGDTMWSRIYDVSGKFLSLVQLSETTFVAAGEYYPNSDSMQGYVCKFALSGSSLWAHAYNAETLPQKFTDIRLSMDGNLYLTGGSPGSLVPHCFLTKMNTSGDTLWTRTYGGDDVAGGAAVCEAQMGYIVAGIMSENGWEQQDVYLVCSGPELSMIQRDNVPIQEMLLSNYPNPFNCATHIEFTLPSTQRVSLRLYDVLGREVAVLMNEIQTAGQHHMMFDASGLPSGVYLCRLDAGGTAQTRKMVLVR
jgi:hypothetical protein